MISDSGAFSFNFAGVFAYNICVRPDLSDSREPELSCFWKFWDVRKFWDDDLLLDLESKKHSLATLIIKLICGALAEDKLDLGGLIHPSFVKAACSLICSGSADMQMVSCSLFSRLDW